MDLSPERILQTGMAFWASKTLLSAVEMELFTELAKHPGDLANVQGRMGLHPRGARDFLDALVALGFLKRSDGVYQNTPETEVFLDKAKPSYIGGILEMCNHRLYPFWGGLTTALRTGEPQNEAKGGGHDFFAALYADPAKLREFLRAMSGVSRGANMAIAQKFPWANYKTCVDIGTAQGDLVTQIALAQPHLRGIGFDLPEVGPIRATSALPGFRPSDQPALALGKLRQLSQAEILEPYHTQRITKSGTVVEVSIISTSLHDEAGKIYAIATTEREIGSEGAA